MTVMQNLELDLSAIGGFSEDTRDLLMRLFRNDALKEAGVLVESDEYDATTTTQLREKLIGVVSRVKDAFDNGESTVEYDDVSDVISERDYFNFFELIVAAVARDGYPVSEEVTSDFVIALE